MTDVRAAVVGGGLAGLAAAVRLADEGLSVELFEARPRLGGRAASFRDPQSGRWVDRCQHVSMGCCTALADLCRRTGLADCFQRHRRLHFFGPDGTRRDFAAAWWLPAPLHLLPALLRLDYLCLKDRLGIVRAMFGLARTQPGQWDESATAGAWLRAHGQSETAIAGFWSVVLRSTLAETVDRASLAAARKVFVDGFLSSRRGYELELPTMPLAELFDRRLGDWLAGHGVKVHRACRVRRIDGDRRRATGLALADGTRRQFDLFVAAVPWHRVSKLLSAPILEAIPALGGLPQIQPVPITAIHLWLDRPIADLRHAALVGRLGQWVFREAGNGGQARPLCGMHHHQVVISGSQELKGRPRESVIVQVLGELAAIWPAARAAHLVRWRVATEPAAVFAMRPGIERLRPPQKTPLSNLALAGDWTATGWPATMEGAVRSGYAAAEAVGRW
jgi:squalene-associated FAD-dependent desaturase